MGDDLPDWPHELPGEMVTGDVAQDVPPDIDDSTFDACIEANLAELEEPDGADAFRSRHDDGSGMGEFSYKEREGGHHVSYFNREGRVHMSWDEDTEGNVSGAHITDHDACDDNGNRMKPQNL